MAEINGASIVNGKLDIEVSPTNNSESTVGTSALGKDAFLQLLVAQMKYQDPLNPSSDTEWISQLATFSSLEEMQNLNSTVANSQAFSLVGQYALVNTTNESTGVTSLTGGKIDYVVMKNGEAQIAINDKLYSIEDLDTITNKEYLDKLIASGSIDGSSTEDNAEETEKEEGKKETE